MKMQAVIIEASTLRGQNDLPGARVDAENHHAFLMSSFGGAWNSFEITRISKPTRNDLLTYIATLSRYDYTFIAFSGHGHHVRGRGLDESRLCINDSEEVSVGELYPQNERCLVVTDSCREVTIIEEEERAVANVLETKKAALRPSREHCRALFEEAIRNAPPGILYMYSCNIGETASESNSRGGYFSRSLIDSATAWAQNQGRPAVLTSDVVFQSASLLTQSKNKWQTPQYEGSTRRRTHFPYAVFSW